MRRRYEDLSLVKMVTRLQRDYLSQQAPGGKAFPGGDDVEHGIADWARPWGPTFLLQFQADLNVFDLQLKSSARWLSAATQRTAKERAAARFASLTAGMAGELKAAEFTLPLWASGRLPSRPPAPWWTARRGAARATRRRGAVRRSGSGGAAPRPGARARHDAGAAGDGPLNLNQASFAELRSLRLSTTQSHRVLAYRKRIGGYESVEQLDEIPGFPEVVRERLKRRVTVS
jgi:hypothetical protein